MKLSIRNLLLLILTFLGGAVQLNAQSLSFKSGKFKIVQFTDIHYVANAEASKKSIATMQSTLDAERPDLVVFTGDIVVKAPSKQGWDEVLEVVISRKIPYIVTLGNHDDESEMTRKEVADYLVTKPLILNKVASREGVHGVLNESFQILGSNGKRAFSIYAMDSNAYSNREDVKGYDWFRANQVNWFRLESQKIFKEQERVVPALAFFHIPLPEYGTAFDDLSNPRMCVRYEKECSPFINSGMFEAMLQQGDVKGTFVGHDHVNDYSVDYYGIALSYGCFTGSENTYTRNKNGARVIELNESVAGFSTYIRESDGIKLYAMSFPVQRKK